MTFTLHLWQILAVLNIVAWVPVVFGCRRDIVEWAACFYLAMFLTVAIWVGFGLYMLGRASA